MYKLVFTDEESKIINTIQCESIELHEDDTKLVLMIDGLEAIHIGCTPSQYFIYKDNTQVLINEILNEDLKSQSYKKEMFRFIEPETVIIKQDEYIRLLEEKLNKLETL